MTDSTKQTAKRNNKHSDDEPQNDEDAIIEKDCVQEASEESFPCSDPPSWTPVTSS